MTRSYAQPDPIDQYISHYFQGALPNERQWLRANQHHLQNPMLVHHAAQIALQRGVPRESPEFLQFVGALLDQHHAAMQAQAAPPPAPPVLPPVPEPQHVAHVDIETEHNEPDEESHIMPAHVSAPVSRDGAHYAGAIGDYEPSANSIRLSKAEREHAVAAGVSDEIYAANKLKMMKLKKAKVIRDE